MGQVWYAMLDVYKLREHPGDKIDMEADTVSSVLSVGEIDMDTASCVPLLGENDNSIAPRLTFGDFDYWTLRAYSFRQ